MNAKPTRKYQHLQYTKLKFLLVAWVVLLPLYLEKKEKNTLQLWDRPKMILIKTQLCKLRVILRSRVLWGVYTLVIILSICTLLNIINTVVLPRPTSHLIRIITRTKHHSILEYYLAVDERQAKKNLAKPYPYEPFFQPVPGPHLLQQISPFAQRSDHVQARPVRSRRKKKRRDRA